MIKVYTVAERFAEELQKEDALQQERQREEHEEIAIAAPSIKILFDKLIRSRNAYWTLGRLNRVELEDDFERNDPIHQTSVGVMTRLLNIEITRPENLRLGYPLATACWFWEIETGCCRRPKRMITVQFDDLVVDSGW